MSIIKVTILGTGNVATHLASAFFQNNIQIVQIYGRNLLAAQKLANQVNSKYTNNLDDLDNADLFIFAVSDSAIIQLLNQGNWSNYFCVHTAGSVPANIFSKYTEMYGVLYPLQTFSKDVPLDIRNVPVFIEASNEILYQSLSEFAHKTFTKVQNINSEQRFFLHLAAVFACNFTNHMFAIAEKITEKQHLDFKIFYPLIEETVRKVFISSPVNFQTGPAIRGNFEIINKHIQLLSEYPDWQKIYTFVTESIQQMHKDVKK